jgi:hypothetical protein
MASNPPPQVPLSPSFPNSKPLTIDSSSAGDGESAENEAGDDEDESRGENTGMSSGSNHVDTTDALAGAAREALRLDPNSGDAAANAFRLHTLLNSCMRRMQAQEQLLQSALAAPLHHPPASASHPSPAATPGKSNDDIARLQDALFTAVRPPSLIIV